MTTMADQFKARLAHDGSVSRPQKVLTVESNLGTGVMLVHESNDLEPYDVVLFYKYSCGKVVVYNGVFNYSNWITGETIRMGNMAKLLGFLSKQFVLALFEMMLGVRDVVYQT